MRIENKGNKERRLFAWQTNLVWLVLNITNAVHPILLLNSFLILVCEGSLLSLCMWEGGQWCTVMCVQSG